MREVDSITEFKRRVEDRGRCLCGKRKGHSGWLYCLSEATPDRGPPKDAFRPTPPESGGESDAAAD